MKLFGIDIQLRNKNSEDVLNVQKEGSISYYADSLLFNNYNYSQVSRNLSAVYRAVELISDSIAILPIEILTEDNKDVNNNYLNLLFSKKSNNKLTKYNFIKLLIQNVILKGSGFAYIKRGTNKVVNELVYLRYEDVTVNKDSNEQIISYTAPKVSNKQIKPEDMIHLIKNSDNGVDGKSVLSFANRTLQISQQTENTAKNYFDNGGSLAGILKVQGQVSEKQREQIKSAWNQTYSTGNNGIAILPGNMEYQSIQINPEDAQLIQTRQFNVQDIARFFGINPVMLGDNSTSSYNTIEAIQTQFVFHTLMPYIQMIEEEFTRKLCPENIIISLDENYLLRTDKQAQVNYYTALLDKGVLSIDEVRQAIGYEAVGLNEHYIPFTDLNQNNLGNKNKDSEEDENK